MAQHGEDEVRPPMPVIRDVLYDDVALYGAGYVFSLYLAVFELESFVFNPVSVGRCYFRYILHYEKRKSHGISLFSLGFSFSNACQM